MPFFHSHFQKHLKGQGQKCTEDVNLTSLTHLYYISHGKVIFHHAFYSLYEFT